jgi:hypothetical protein
MAALISARAAVAGGDLAGAKTQLKWVMDNARDEDTRDLARLRLAGVLLDEKSYPEALALVETKVGDSLAGLYAELKGDILTAQGKAAEARNAYRSRRQERKRAHAGDRAVEDGALGEPAVKVRAVSKCSLAPGRGGGLGMRAGRTREPLTFPPTLALSPKPGGEGLADGQTSDR